MAVTFRWLTTPHEGTIKLGVWEGLSAGEAGPAINCAGYPDTTVQLVGTFGGNVRIEGSLDPDGRVYATLNDRQGNALAGISAATIKTVDPSCYLIRPVADAHVDHVAVWLMLFAGGR